MGKTDSINWLALNPCYCTKAALAPWSQFNFESLLSENNGMSANLVPIVQKDFHAACVSAVTRGALGRNGSPGSAAALTWSAREGGGTCLGQHKSHYDLTAWLTHTGSQRQTTTRDGKPILASVHPDLQHREQALRVYTVFANPL